MILTEAEAEEILSDWTDEDFEVLKNGLTLGGLPLSKKTIKEDLKAILMDGSMTRMDIAGFKVRIREQKEVLETLAKESKALKKHNQALEAKKQAKKDRKLQKQERIKEQVAKLLS